MDRMTIFYVGVVQFEMNQWMEPAGSIHGFGDIVWPPVEHWKDDINAESARAAIGLLEIMEWNRR